MLFCSFSFSFLFFFGLFHLARFFFFSLLQCLLPFITALGKRERPGEGRHISCVGNKLLVGRDIANRSSVMMCESILMFLRSRGICFGGQG